MSFYDDASLVFLPSGGAGKDTKAYSIKPTDGSGDFTFSRGSNLTATRVDSNGLIEKGRENLLTQSNSFDNAIWIGRSQTTLIEGQGGYDGSNDAWSCATTTGQIMGQSKVNQGVQTISVYAKGSVSNGLRIFAFGNDNVDFWFNLNTGLPDGSISSKVIDYNIEDVNGDGEWYRCSFTFSQTTSSIYFYCTDNNKSNASGTIYLQDAQLEQGLVATEYIESGATKGKAGILEHSPRFDYSGGASCPSLLLEPSRTNIVPISEGIPEDTNAVTLTENYGTSPEGVQNSLKVQKDGVSSNDRILPIDNYNATLVSGTSYSVSAFVKNIDVVNSGVTTIGCRLGIGGTLFRLGYEWNGSSLAISTTYAAGTRTNEILEDYGNGWWRIGFSFEADNTQGNIELDIDRDNGSDTTSIETYGWQLEEGSYPTSYIPNHSGGSETRDADVTSVTSVSDLIGQTEGTIYCEFEYNGAADTGVFNRIIALGTGVTQNRILLAKNNTTAELVAFAVTGGTTQVFQAISGTSIIGHHKVAISYKANEYKVYLDGELEFTDTSASVPATTDVYVGTAEDGTTDNELGGVVKQSIIFKEVLSVDNCKALTTL
jgi:hypothetical protein